MVTCDLSGSFDVVIDSDVEESSFGIICLPKQVVDKIIAPIQRDLKSCLSFSGS
jgi:hypothetical protein